jgi:hypothetical protein
MSTGTVTLHSWNDDNEDDEAEPVMGTNYNARLDLRDDYNRARDSRRSREGGLGLRSTIVRPRRLGDEGNGDDGALGTGGGGW